MSKKKVKDEVPDDPVAVSAKQALHSTKEEPKTVRIQYLCRYIGKKKLHVPGKIQEVDKEKAEKLIAANVAEKTGG